VASLRSTIELVITGSTRGLNAAAAEARAMAERIAAAEDRVSDARRRSAEANSRVAEVEARLNAARARSGEAARVVADAEARTADARTRSLSSAGELSRAEADLARARANGSSQEIAQAETRIQQARARAQTDARNLANLEQQLANARRSANSSSSAVTALEERLARARGQAFRASEDLARAENNLNATRRRGTDDMNRQRSGILGVFDALGRLADAFSGADGASTTLLSKMAALHSVFTSIGGPIVQAVVGILEFVAILGAAGEIIGVVGGLIGQVFAGVPAILLAAAAAAGTVALGLDGIKKAAEVMAPAFDKLKAAVSGTFQRELTPVFRDLAGLLPKLTSGFQDIAVALSGVGRQLVSTFTSTRGIDLLNQVLAGTANLIRGLGPGITTFFNGLTQAAAAAAPAMTSLGAAIGGIAGKIGEVFTKLAADGTIQAAVTGLAATLQGLGDVIGPVIELLIRMGAALGGTLGAALSDLGKTIESMIPFFVHLAQVAGDLLVSAFQQLGPAIIDVINQLLPRANQGLDGFANVIEHGVLPAIADFIRQIPSMLEVLKQFFLAATANALSFASSFLAAMSGILNVLHGFFAAMALIPGPMQKSFAEAAAVTDAFRGKVDELKAGVDGLHDKTVKLQLQAVGAQEVKGIKTTIDSVTDKTVKIISSVFGLPENEKLKAAIDAVPANKSSTTTSTVTGEPQNRTLKQAIDEVVNKVQSTVSNVSGEPQNRSLKSAIDAVISKTVQVTANVSGEGAVRALVSAIAAVHDKTVTVISNVINNVTKAFAKGGRVPVGESFLVGEKGPELLTLDSRGGIVTPAGATRKIMEQLNGRQAIDPLNSRSGDAAGGDAPITVNVMLSQEQIAGIAQVEIARRDRATKRTVLAGSGVTF
jgi:hypothetical protein